MRTGAPRGAPRRQYQQEGQRRGSQPRTAAREAVWAVCLPLVPERAAVDVWLALLDGGNAAGLERYLAPDELARAAAFIDPAAGCRHVVARGTLRQMLAHYLDCGPADVRLEYGEYGKPRASAIHGSAIHFNVSHSGGLAAYAVCRTTDVGIDIEQDDGGVDPGELAPTICSAAELRKFQGCPASEQRTMFFRLWTRKEAYLKCLGRGLSMEPDTVEVPESDTPDQLAGEGDLRCSVRTLPAPPAFYLSVASRSGAMDIGSCQWWHGRAPE
jgi:4'-phosphopantetheinyl transferase